MYVPLFSETDENNPVVIKCQAKKQVILTIVTIYVYFVCT